MQTSTRERTFTGGLIDSFWLKIIAVVAMIIDHIAYGLYLWNFNFDAYWVMRFIGRLTFPIMAFLLIEGFRHTRSFYNYALRLWIFALLSIIPFYLLFHAQEKFTAATLVGNVMFTLFASLIMLNLISKVKSIWFELLIVLAAMIVTGWSDWGVIGPLIVYIYYKVENRLLAGFLSFIPFIIFTIVWPMYEQAGRYDNVWDNLKWYLPNLGFILPIFIINLYNGKRGINNKFVKWGYYAFYPVHILLLFLYRRYVMHLI